MPTLTSYPDPRFCPRPCSQHPPNIPLALVLLQPSIQMLPPFEQHSLTDQLEPRREL